ncbi:MAG: alpha/beta hydrolase-fold protein [Opitutaceae bacterium]
MISEETTIAVSSEVLGNQRPVWVRAVGERPAAMLVLLDGEFYRNGIDAERTVRELVESGSIEPVWLVMVSHHSPAARWIECPCHPPFAHFVVGDLLPALARAIPELDEVKRRVLVGVSYTGLAAAFVALRCPGVFQHVICQSGSFWWNEGWLSHTYRELGRPLPTAFFLEVGSRENKGNIRHREDVLQRMTQIEGVTGFRDALGATGHDVTYQLFEGGHDFASWQHTLPGALVWALGGGGPAGVELRQP